MNLPYGRLGAQDDQLSVAYRRVRIIQFGMPWVVPGRARGPASGGDHLISNSDPARALTGGCHRAILTMRFACRVTPAAGWPAGTRCPGPGRCRHCDRPAGPASRPGASDIDRRASPDAQHGKPGKSHGRGIGAAVHQVSHPGRLRGNEIPGPVGGLVARGKVYVMIFQFPAQAGDDTANRPAPCSEPDCGRIP